MDVNGPYVKKTLRRYLAEPKKKVRLKNYDSAWVPREELKAGGGEAARDQLVDLLEKNRKELADAQEILAASREYSILIVLQGMDTAGKDGTIRHVMSGVNPQGCSVRSFKVPNAEEHAHDFLWRYGKVLPERGMIGIFNRSYYEDVLVVRVHPDRMEELPLTIGPGADGFWEGRFKDINAFEKHLVRNSTLILKFFLHISKDEQKRRLLDRLSHQEKFWKFSFTDIAERQFWDGYRDAYEEMLTATSTTYAPWFVIPADHKWAARTIVAEIITSAIEGLHLAYPAFSDERLHQLNEAKKELEQE